MLHAGSNPFGQVATIGVVPHLLSGAENVERVLSFQYLLCQVGHYVRHGELHVSAIDIMIVKGPLLSHPNTIKWPGDGIWQLVLFPCALDEILGCQFLEPIGRPRWRAALLGSF